MTWLMRTLKAPRETALHACASTRDVRCRLCSREDWVTRVTSKEPSEPLLYFSQRTNISSSCEKQACQLMQVSLLKQLWLQAGLSTVPNCTDTWVTSVVVTVGCKVQAPEGHGNKG